MRVEVAVFLVQGFRLGGRHVIWSLADGMSDRQYRFLYREDEVPMRRCSDDAAERWEGDCCAEEI